MITNRTPASCDFVITRLISDQIALHSVQLRMPLYIIFNIEALFKLEMIYFCNPTIYTGLQKINVFLNLTIAEFPKHKSIRFFDKMVVAVYRHSKIYKK